ncbi:MAG: SCO family protein, partial [Rhodospirillaceae bacterium]
MIRGSVKKVGAFLLAVVLAGPAIIAPAVIAPASELKLAFDDRAALEISRNAIGGTIGDYRFVDHRGRTVRLAELKGRPLVVSLVYTACYQTCPLTTVNLVRAVAEADSKLGADRFGVVTLGFDTRFDTPDHMAAFARGQGIDRRGWLVLG